MNDKVFDFVFADPKVQKAETKQIDIGKENVKPKPKVFFNKIELRTSIPKPWREGPKI